MSAEVIVNSRLRDVELSYFPMEQEVVIKNLTWHGYILLLTKNSRHEELADLLSRYISAQKFEKIKREDVEKIHTEIVRFSDNTDFGKELMRRLQMLDFLLNF